MDGDSPSDSQLILEKLESIEQRLPPSSVIPFRNEAFSAACQVFFLNGLFVHQQAPFFEFSIAADRSHMQGELFSPTRISLWRHHWHLSGYMEGP